MVRPIKGLSSNLNDEIVKEPNRPEPDGSQQHDGSPKTCQGFKCVCVATRQVVNAVRLSRVDEFGHGLFHQMCAAYPPGDCVLPAQQRAIEDKRPLTLRGGQVLIARTARESIGVANGRAEGDACVHRHVLHQLPDHQTLLIIFLAQKRLRGPDQV